MSAGGPPNNNRWKAAALALGATAGPHLRHFWNGSPARPMWTGRAPRSVQKRKRAGGRVVARGGRRVFAGPSTGRFRRRSTRPKLRGGRSRTLTKTRGKKRKRSKSKAKSKTRKHKRAYKLVKPRSFKERVETANLDVPWDRTIFSSSQYITTTNQLRTTAANRWITLSAFGSFCYTEAGTYVGYGDSLYAYALAATNAVVHRANYLYTLASGYPITSSAAGTFGSALEGASRINTITDAGRSAYTQFKSYTDSYTINNAGNTAAIVRIWQVKPRKNVSRFVNSGTMAGATVAGAGAPTYLSGTGGFETQLEAAAIMEEYADTSVYDAIATWPPPVIANTGSLKLVYSAIWDLPMTKLRTLKKFWKIKKTQVVIPVGGRHKFTIKYKDKIMSTLKLALERSLSVTTEDTLMTHSEHGTRLLFQVIGQDGISNDADYQCAPGPATVVVTNRRELLARAIVSASTGMVHRSSDISSLNNQGFNRSWATGVPEIIYAQPMPFVTQVVPLPGHLPVDAHMLNQGGTAWIEMKAGPTAATSLYATAV